ncbi:MAG: hypothetical protein Q8P81_04130 [Nanoarchaeota archaeon]|nr:hypothetical protein [Nanoarchaeota archaeon]
MVRVEDTVLVHFMEGSPEVKRRREEAGLVYVGSILLEGDNPMDACFYDDAILADLFSVGNKRHKVCPECLTCYQVPASS